MADNFTANAGSGGDTFGADDIGGVKFPRSKIIIGADGTNDGDISAANPIPIVAGTGVAIPVTDNSGSLTVDGTVTANQGGTWNITDVSGTVSLPTGAATAAKQPALGTAGTASADVITIQGVASMTAIQVADNGGSLTVDGTVTANLAPTTSGGLTISRTISAASTNATNVKGSAGQIYGILVSNTNAAARYLKLYNKATSPTIGTDTPVLTIMIPPNSSGVVGSWEHGLAFGTGIGFGLTTGVADSDTAAVAANEQVVHIFYK